MIPYWHARSHSRKAYTKLLYSVHLLYWNEGSNVRRFKSDQGRMRPVDNRTLSVKLKFHGTNTDIDTDFLADFRATILAEVGAMSRTDLSADFCLTRAFAREDVLWGCARVHVDVYCT